MHHRTRAFVIIDAFHLPGLSQVPTTTWAFGTGEGAFELRVPSLTPALLREQVRALGHARERALADRPAAEIVGVIDRVAARLLDPADALRVTAERALPAITRYSPPMIRRVLDRMAADWRAERLRDLLSAELGDAGALDGWVPAPHGRGRVMALGPRLATHVFSGNVPGVAVTSLVRALLARSASLGKTAAGEPLLPALFARGIAEEDAELGACLAVTYWAGGDRDLERAALEHADAVIVYGGRGAVEAIRALTPTGARFLAYGPRLSFGVVGRTRLAPGAAAEVARAAALDASTFDQQGCVSPHVFYVEEGGEVGPREWATLLAREMEAVERELPRGTLAPGEASAIRQLRGEAEFAAGVELHASASGTAWTVIHDPDPAFEASCLNRVVRVKPVASLADVPALVAEYGEVLQTVGIAAEGGEAAELAAGLGRLGASRICPIGAMAWPPPWWHHDGMPPLRALLRWCDWEG
ncbi:MAG TPA: acyl-CoA reductase [Longimicrobium sp.]|nr:acyl-CoA reductase [Longimicrobium sp.]